MPDRKYFGHNPKFVPMPPIIRRNLFLIQVLTDKTIRPGENTTLCLNLKKKQPEMKCDENQ